MRLFLLLVLNISALCFGTFFFINALGFLWYGNLLATALFCMAVGAILSAVFSFIGTYTCRRLHILPSILVAIPTFLFALASLGSLYEEPLAFVFWFSLGAIMLLSGYSGGKFCARALLRSKSAEENRQPPNVARNK
jgi:hypothetical protein